MSTTRDWMRGGEEDQRLERRRSGLGGVLIWSAVVALATFAALALQQIMS